MLHHRGTNASLGEPAVRRLAEERALLEYKLELKENEGKRRVRAVLRKLALTLKTDTGYRFGKTNAQKEVKHLLNLHRHQHCIIVPHVHPFFCYEEGK